MNKIKCIRGEGLQQGEDIYNPILSTIPSLIMRGTHEINKTVSHRKIVTVNGSFTELFPAASFVEKADELGFQKGVVVRSSITVSASLDTVSVVGSLEMECLNE